VQRQEQLKRDTLEYEYQLKASLKQQKIQEELRMQQDLQLQNQAFQRQLMKEQEAEKRETSKQKIASLFNMFSSSMGNLMSNPKLLTKTASLAFCMFGAFHLSKFSMQIL
jgi:hypothetical protein